MKKFTFLKLLGLFTVISLISCAFTVYYYSPDDTITLEMVMEDGSIKNETFYDMDEVEDIHVDSIQPIYGGRFRHYLCKTMVSGFDNHRIMRIGVKKFKIIE